MQRLFSTFPDGWPGIGLLLLRTGAAIVLIVQGAACFLHEGAATWGTWAVGAVAALSGSLLLIGLITPVAGALGALDIAGIALGFLPSRCSGPARSPSTPRSSAAARSRSLRCGGPPATSESQRAGATGNPVIQTSSRSSAAAAAAAFCCRVRTEWTARK